VPVPVSITVWGSTSAAIVAASWQNSSSGAVALFPRRRPEGHGLTSP